MRPPPEQEAASLSTRRHSSSGHSSSGPSTRQRAGVEGASAAGERLTRQDRLRRRDDYRRCYEEGQRVHGRWATLFVCDNQEPRPRVGVTASRRVGKSVVRHRLRRWVKEIYRRSRYRRHLPAVDLVVHLKAVAAEATFDELRRGLDRQLRRVARQART